MTFEPDVLLRRITAETDRLLATARRLDDEAMRRPSLLPGWTRGHVLTHVARNADGGRRLLTWARTGVEQHEYESLEARAAEIEAGADRPAAALVADVRHSADRFAEACAAMPAGAWNRLVRWTAGQEHAVSRATDARLTEVVVHHADLAAGYSPADWPADFVTDMLEKVAENFANRTSPPPVRLHVQDSGATYELATGDTPWVSGSQTALLAWLMGRSTGDDLTVAGGRELPVPPHLY